MFAEGQPQQQRLEQGPGRFAVFEGPAEFFQCGNIVDQSRHVESLGRGGNLLFFFGGQHQHLGIGAGAAKDHQIPQVFNEQITYLGGTLAGIDQFVNSVQDAGAVRGSHPSKKLQHLLLVGDAHQFVELGGGQRLDSGTDALVQKAQGVSHGTIGQAGQVDDQITFVLDLLIFEDLFQLLADDFGTDILEIEPLAT